MPTEAQRAAVARYDASGKRPGKLITLRLTDEQHERIEAQRQQDESFSACIKRLLNLPA